MPRRFFFPLVLAVDCGENRDGGAENARKAVAFETVQPRLCGI
ncbi:hypothetical protein N0B44_05340 [Roseibacterium beibuensis]|nr:hypothetical protein [Roseibacterium beibuensis]